MGLFRYRMHSDSWSYLNEIDFYYQSFRMYSERIDSFINEDLKNVQGIYNKNKMELENTPDEGEMINYEMDLKTSETLVDLYYDAFIISMYSFTEKKMFILCNYLSKNYIVKVNDIAGKGIFKFYKYLTKVCGIDFAPVQNAWDTIVQFNLLRNHLVHAEGNRSIPKSNQQLVRFISQLPEANLTEDGDELKFHFTGDASLYRFLACSQTVVHHIYCEKSG